MLKEFKDFIARGNVIDLAIGVIMATSFGAIVNSLVNDILMPLIGALMSGVDFSKYTVKVMGVDLAVGVFINAIITFVIVSFVMFLIVKAFNEMKKAEEPAPVTTKTCPACMSQVHIDATRCPHCTSEIK